MKRINAIIIFLAAAGFLFVFSQPAQAAVTEATPATEMLTANQKIKASSSYTPLFGFSLTQNASETLSSVTFTILGTVTPTSMIGGLRIYADDSNTGANNDVIDGGDTICGTQASVNINTATTINTGTCAIPSSKTGTYDFIAAIATSASIMDGRTITFNVAAGTSAYGLSAGNVTATALIAVNNLTAAPAVSSVVAFTDRLIINFNESVDGGTASSCSNFVIDGSVVSCGGYGSSWTEFQGNKITIKGLTLSGTISFSIPANNTIKSTLNTTTLIAYSNASLAVNALTLPAITSLSATSGAVGDSITITGTNFGATQGSSKVYFSGGYGQNGPAAPIEAASYTSWSNTSIVVVVPTGTQGGPVKVMVGGIESDMNQNSFFDIKGNYTARIYYSTDNSTPMPNADNGNIRFAMGGMGGMTIFKVGDGRMTYSNGSPGTFTITGVASMGYIWAFDVTGNHLNSSGSQVNTSSTQTIRLLSTTRKVSGTITMGATCVAAGQNKNVVVMGMPQVVDMGGEGFKHIEPAFFTTGPTNGQTACQTTYSIGVPVNGAYRIEAHIPPDASVSTYTSSAFSDPSGQTVTITDSALTAIGINFTFTTSTHRIVGTVTKPSGTLSLTDKGMLWVWAYQPQGGKGTGTQVANDGTFTLNVSKGVWKVGVSGSNMPFPVEMDVNVDDTYLVALPPKGPTIVIAPPSDFIEGYVKDTAGTGLSNVSLYAWREGGPGGGNARTDSQGYYKMYVTPGTGYRIGAHSQTYGFLGEQSDIAVSSSVHPTVNFDVSSSNYTISGTITKNGQALQQAYVFISSGENGSMMGGGGTDSAGAYSAKVRGGSSYWIHVGLPGKGEIYKASLGTVGADATQNITITSSTIKVRVSPASSVDSAFVGANSSTSKAFSNTSIVTSNCTGSGTSCMEYQIDVMKPGSGSTTYYVDGYVPGFGSLSQISVAINSSGNFTDTSGTANDGIIEYTLSDFYTVSGTVSGDDVNSAYVWAASSSGGNGAQVSSDGAYSLRLKNGTYDLGVNKPKYMSEKTSITVNGANLTGQNLTLTSASLTITGTVYLPDGTTIVTNAKVWASNGTGGFAVATTDASGAYTLNVGSGSWTVKAAYDGYNSSSTTVTAPATGMNITLAAISGYSASTTNSPVTPSSGGVVQTTGAKVDFPASSLGTGTTAGTVQIKSTTNVPTISSAVIVGTPKEITATNSSNQTITTLSGNATITLTATRAELTAQSITTVAQVREIEIKYWDSTANNWVTLPTTVTLSAPTATLVSELDSDPAVTFTATVSHLSDFALASPTGAVVLAVPTNLSASAGIGSVALSWSAVSGATKYDIYKESGGLYPYYAQTTSLSYTATSLTNGAEHSFKVSALDDSNNESAATSAVSATPMGAGGGSSSLSWTATSSETSSATAVSTVVPVSTAPAATPVSATPTSGVTTTSTKPISQMTISEIKAEIARILNLINQLKAQIATGIPAESEIPTGYKFNRILKLGQISEEVKYLQIFLNSDSDTKVADSGPGSPGSETDKFGPLTKAAVIRFQEKHAEDILTPIGYAKGTGKVGLMTIGKINELMGR